MAIDSLNDDAQEFYHAVAKHCGKAQLTEQEATLAYRARVAAVAAYEMRGAAVSPCCELVFAVSWYLAQDALITGGREPKSH